tara:strand:+ start:748 stop:876 length:129 start_codon:yes stop_codon:yes gene_type:complete
VDGVIPLVGPNHLDEQLVRRRRRRRLALVKQLYREDMYSFLD